MGFEKKVILVASDTFGKGDQQLGETVLETFFTILKQQETLPHAVFCMNSGVKALTNASLVSLHLGELEQKGVEVLACRTCVDHYGVESDLAAGKIKGMNDFIQLASEYEVITVS
ncbi:transcriptional regulator [Paenibacillus albiflavus]|uniref:Transcriptional regulator n=1 Tax=Paenibacillus albiflavus TaxID=2545760 RepID=A0A4R4EKD6_9BACL|nr:DsrE family protein [Paenibacillus albiflavus]TCZ78851.1 transcriptional regulator [Paenibacillus albiflavus]